MMLADTSDKTKGGNFGVITDKTLSFAEYFNEINKKACFTLGLVIFEGTLGWIEIVNKFSDHFLTLVLHFMQ